MFKAIKILNGGSNVPEPCTMYTAAGTAYRYGTALTVSAGKVVNATETDMPLYIAGETLAADEKSSIICYRVLENIVFETTLMGSPMSLKCGSKVTLSLSDDGFANAVSSSTTDGVATVVDIRGTLKTGDKVCVQFLK